MKIPKSIGIILFWIIVLAGFLVFQNQRLLAGRDIWIKPIPIDPTDLFRGDYVTLSYDFSTYHKAESDIIPKESQVVYAVMKLNAYNSAEGLDYYEFSHFSATNIIDYQQISIKGFAPEGLEDGSRIIYNIESFFIPEGTGKQYEAEVGQRLKVLVHINGKGEASIKKTNINDLIVKEK